MYNSAPPNVGNGAFQNRYNTLFPNRSYSLINEYDPVPKIPPVSLLFYHVGINLTFYVNWNGSECLDMVMDLAKPKMIISQIQNCSCNHDARCIYAYTLNRMSSTNTANSCNSCKEGESCLFCLSNTTYDPPYTECLFNLAVVLNNDMNSTSETNTSIDTNTTGGSNTDGSNTGGTSTGGSNGVVLPSQTSTTKSTTSGKIPGPKTTATTSDSESSFMNKIFVALSLLLLFQ